MVSAMDDAEQDRARRLREWNETKARSLELLARCISENGTVPRADLPAADDAFTLWCAERPAPSDIPAWLARMPAEASMMTAPIAQAPPDTPASDPHKALRKSITELRREMRELRAEIAATIEATRSETATNLTTILRELCDEIGRVTGTDAKRIDALTKRLDAMTGGKPKIVA
jgi:hypothetical protein